jgi:hypothetical protein
LIPDAIEVVRNKIELDELINLLEGDEEKAHKIMKVRKDVERYSFFSRAIKLGISYGKRDLTFSDFLLFSCIKEKIDG